jgi:hypothetical protein
VNRKEAALTPLLAPGKVISNQSPAADPLKWTPILLLEPTAESASRLQPDCRRSAMPMMAEPEALVDGREEKDQTSIYKE